MSKHQDDDEVYLKEKPGVEQYMENLKNGRKKKEAPKKPAPPKKIIAGAEYLDTIPHAPWPSRAMLKRRVVLGMPDMKVRNGVTRIIYPTGSMYEGEVVDGKRHGLGVYTWKQGDSYAGMWFMGLMHGLGVAEFASEAAYLGEWYLADRVGYGMYFYSPQDDEPHSEYAGVWRNDALHGVGKRLSKNGTVYLGMWRGGIRHGDGICRVAQASALTNPIGAAANAIRNFQGKGATGRYSKLDAKHKAEIDTEELLGGIHEWHAEAPGITLQEGRFMNDEYEPRDKEEIRLKQLKKKKDEVKEEARSKEEKKEAERKNSKKEKKNKKKNDKEADEEEPSEDEELKEDAAKVERRKLRQHRLRQMAKRSGKELSAKDFPDDHISIHEFEPQIQIAMETADAAEMIGIKVKAKYRGANFAFRVLKIEKDPGL